MSQQITQQEFEERMRAMNNMRPGKWLEAASLPMQRFFEIPEDAPDDFVGRFLAQLSLAKNEGRDVVLPAGWKVKMFPSPYSCTFKVDDYEQSFTFATLEEMQQFLVDREVDRAVFGETTVKYDKEQTKQIRQLIGELPAGRPTLPESWEEMRDFVFGIFGVEEDAEGNIVQKKYGESPLKAVAKAYDVADLIDKAVHHQLHEGQGEGQPAPANIYGLFTKYQWFTPQLAALVESMHGHDPNSIQSWESLWELVDDRVKEFGLAYLWTIRNSLGVVCEVICFPNTDIMSVSSDGFVLQSGERVKREDVITVRNPFMASEQPLKTPLDHPLYGGKMITAVIETGQVAPPQSVTGPDKQSIADQCEAIRKRLQEKK
jgi:hypothetical protein